MMASQNSKISFKTIPESDTGSQVCFILIK